MMSRIPFVDVVLTHENLDEGVRKILAVAKPEWDLSQPVQKKPLSGGYINITIAYYPSHLTQRDGVVVKTAQEFFVGPMPELQRTFQFLHDNHLGPPVLAFFGNGHCMSYVDGEICNRIGPRLFDDEIWQPIVAKIAEWQCKEISRKAQEYQLRYVPAYIMPCETEYEGIMSRQPLSNYKDRLPNLEQLKYEEQTLVKEMRQRGVFELVVSHGDLNASNIIVDVAEQKACLGDNDYSGLYHEEFGLASFFCTILDPLIPYENFSPNTEFELRVIRHYLENKRQFNGLQDDDSSVSDRDVREFWHNVQCAKPLMNLTFIACAVFVNDKLHKGLENWIEFGTRLWSDFHDYKGRTMAARDEYVSSIRR